MCKWYRDRVLIDRDETNADVEVGRLLDLPAGKNAIGVAIDDQRQHHAWIILRAAAATAIDREFFHIDALDRLDYEMHEVVLRQSRRSGGIRYGWLRLDGTNRVMSMTYTIRSGSPAGS